MSRFKNTGTNTYRKAKTALQAHAAAEGYPDAIDYVVAQVASGHNISSLWREIGTAYSSRQLFDAVARRLSRDAVSRIDAVRSRRFMGNRPGKHTVLLAAHLKQARSEVTTSNVSN